MKAILKRFYLNNSERQGAIALILIIIACVIGPELFRRSAEATPTSSDLLKINNSSFVEEEEEEESELVLFRFDPNIISEDSIQLLPISKKAKRNWINYRSKGARFYSQRDFFKIYSLTEEDKAILGDSLIFNSLKGYAKKQYGDKSYNKKQYQHKQYEKKDCKKSQYGNKKYERNSYEKKQYPSKERSTKLVDLNNASAEELKEVYGIGAVFSKRILKYRNLLGGYSNVGQLKEVYGMTEESFSEIKEAFLINPAQLKKIDINNIEFKDLLRHPYVGIKEVKAIINYRDQHGAFLSASDLLQIKTLDEGFINKLKPYLIYKSIEEKNTLEVEEEEKDSID